MCPQVFLIVQSLASAVFGYWCHVDFTSPCQDYEPVPTEFAKCQLTLTLYKWFGFFGSLIGLSAFGVFAAFYCRLDEEVEQGASYGAP